MSPKAKTSPKARANTPHHDPSARPTTHTAIILDRSGSMMAHCDLAISSFNAQLDAVQRASNDVNTTISLVTFSTVVDEPTLWLANPDSATRLTHENYQPDGQTALFDAIGETVSALNNIADAALESTRFIAVIISDGCENNSTSHTKESVRALLDGCRASERWDFIFCGMPEDLSAAQEHLGFAPEDVIAFSGNALMHDIPCFIRRRVARRDHTR